MADNQGDPTTGTQPGADSPVVVVANRLPVDQVTDPDGSTRWQRSPGGLVTALEPFVAGRGGAWVGWSGSAGEAPEPFESGGMSLIPVQLTEDEVDRYYEGMSNASLWPLYHDVVEKPEYHRTWWDTYVQVNKRFAERAAAVAGENAIVWVHDYQLQLVPALLRQRRPDLTIGFFLHIPFPPYELFTQLPWRSAIVEGLLGADLVGFQRPAAAANFVQLARRLHDLPARKHLIEYDGRTVAARAFPISIDAAAFDELARSPEVLARAEEIRKELGNPSKIILGVDRLDYTKGIGVRLEAFEELLEDGAVEAPDTVLVQVATPSRERVEHYVHMRETIEQKVGHINGVFGSIAGPAVHYFNQSMPREELAALYRAADVMLVTPYRDGMNLVAKEYVAARGDLGGALVLSEFAGAAAELKQGFLVNPHDIAGVKSQLLRALRMEPAEGARRMRAMRRHLFKNDLEHWAGSFFDALRDQASGQPSGREAGRASAPLSGDRGGAQG
jgi:trehalose 6-phosphate synthase